MRHPARFVLVGSGNPEEGELRPQLLDRFGLSVEVRTPQDLPSRVEVVKRRDAFERDADAFVERWSKDEAARATPDRRRPRARRRLCECPMRRSNARRSCAWRWAPTACAAN